MKGGKRPGAGRPPGAVNKKTAEVQAAVAASGLTPLDYMLGVLRDPAYGPLLRMDAAKAAAPYVHPKLSATELSGSLNITNHEDALGDLE
jgi:hypothetical protein